jgi:integrase
MKLPSQFASELGGKPWVKVDVNALLKQAGVDVDIASLAQGQSNDPTQGLSMVRGADSVIKVGPEQVRGDDTTHYKIIVNLDKAIAEAPADERDMLSKVAAIYTVRTFPVDLWLDSEGRVHRFQQTIDPSTEIPPAGVFAVRDQRPTPYLWSQHDIRRLLDAARELRPLLKAASYEALFGLLAVTGIRLGEAITLTPDDVDLDQGVLTIRQQTAKLERARLVPLHPTAARALERYTETRTRLCPAPRSSTFFLSGTGTSLNRSAVAKTLRELTPTLGLRTETVRPHAHQLRHSFAVSTLMGWQRSGVVTDEQIAVLSTYLGHVSPAETYWYLTATPELMGAAAQRLERHLGGRS